MLSTSSSRKSGRTSRSKLGCSGAGIAAQKHSARDPEPPARGACHRFDRLPDYHERMRHDFGPYGGFDGHWVIGLVFGLVMLLLIIAAVVVIVRVVGKRPPGAPPLWGGGSWWQTSGPHHALSELDLRYARGEVDRNDYLQRRADLLGQPHPSGGAPAPGPGTSPTPKAP